MSVHTAIEGAVAIVTIERPKARNAINSATARAIGDAIERASADPNVRGVILTGSGSLAFVSGGDLHELATLTEQGNGAAAVLAMANHMSVIETCDVPVIAAVQGDAYGGGCELLLLCDMVIAEEQTSLAFRHAKMGLVPAWGGMTRLIERVGPIEATRLLFTAEQVGAHEAMRIGLINAVAPTGGARAAAAAYINTIAKNARSSVTALKKTLHAVKETRRNITSHHEQEAFTAMWGGPEHRIAMDAFFARKR